MEKVHEEYSKVESAISEIASNFFDALNDQQAGFLAAYKSSFDVAQAKVHAMKQDIDQREKAVSDHVKVKEIEKERNRYRQEAIRLEKQLNESKKRESDLKERLDEVSSDRRWLSDQVKHLMKLKAALENQVAQAQVLENTSSVIRAVNEPVDN